MIQRTTWRTLSTRRDRGDQVTGSERSGHVYRHWILQLTIGILILLWAVFGTPLSTLAHTSSESASPEGHSSPSTNLFPSGQCTWWANERYHQLHGLYVPWTHQANAWQWTDRAKEFGWQRSATPQHIGSILVLQPWTQGAYGLGHVAVVEKIFSNGHVLTSNLNWLPHQATITAVEFAPGPGVSFIDQINTSEHSLTEEGMQVWNS